MGIIKGINNMFDDLLSSLKVGDNGYSGRKLSTIAAIATAMYSTDRINDPQLLLYAIL